MEKQSVYFDLSNTVRYQVDGDFQESAQIEMLAPTYKTIDHVTKLSQFMAGAFIDVTQRFQTKIDENQDVKEEMEQKMDDKFVKLLLLASKDDVGKLIHEFEKMAKFVCFLDTERKVPLSKTLLEQFSYDDIINMITAYMVHFIVPSFM